MEAFTNAVVNSVSTLIPRWQSAADTTVKEQAKEPLPPISDDPGIAILGAGIFAKEGK